MNKTLNSKTENRLVQVASGPVNLQGQLRVPDNARGIVLFAHGSGSSSLSPRNQYVADVLDRARFATLLIDLLAPHEEVIDKPTGNLRFNINFLTERLIDATEWIAQNPDVQTLRIGYFGASTGAAAALMAAAERPESIHAIVSRGGRPDLAVPVLSNVQAPTLLIVGGNDAPVIEMNQKALAHLRVEKQLEIVPGATHLFEEPGALEEVARLASEWFDRYLGQDRE